MQKNDILELKIESIANGGLGVSKVDGFVVFTPFVIEGETVKAQILKIKNNYAEAKLLEILKQSNNRISPKCEYYTICGGCAYQHISYKHQLKLKHQQINELFTQMKVKEPEIIEETEPSPLCFYYRTKIRMKYKKRKVKTVFGYFDHYNNDILDIKHCPIAKKSLNNHIKMVRGNNFEFFQQKRIRSYNLAFMESHEGVVDNLSPKKDIQTKVQNFEFHYTKDTFFQINHSIFNSLIQYLQNLIQDHTQNPKTLLDLYCGVGFFGILLSKHFEKIFFLEENKASFKYLLRNIELNQLHSKAITQRSSADELSQSLNEEIDVILMDPPRSGATQRSINIIASMNPKIIIYISCNPSTQVRDIQVFNEKGYTLKTLKPFDFFPQTKHVESIALLKKQ